MCDRRTSSRAQYRLEELLGRGAMGEVWRSVDVLHARMVAIKLLNAGIAASDPVLVSKFRQEAQIAVRLDHAGITKVNNFGEYKGQWYLVMELLEGENLARELARFHGGCRSSALCQLQPGKRSQ